jgi:hypothetical protein
MRPADCVTDTEYSLVASGRPTEVNVTMPTKSLERVVAATLSGREQCRRPRAASDTPASMGEGNGTENPAGYAAVRVFACRTTW